MNDDELKQVEAQLEQLGRRVQSAGAAANLSMLAAEAAAADYSRLASMIAKLREASSK